MKITSELWRFYLRFHGVCYQVLGTQKLNFGISEQVQICLLFRIIMRMYMESHSILKDHFSLLRALATLQLDCSLLMD